MKPVFLAGAALVLPLSACSAQNPPANAPVSVPKPAAETAAKPASATASIHLEAEDAALQGATKIATTRPGFSGQGYVTGFEKDGDTFSTTLYGVQAGVYDVVVRYAAESDKGFGLIVNGAKSSGTFLASGGKFRTQKAGKIVLKDGDNTLAIDRGWGYYDIDAIDLTPAKIDGTLPKPPLTLVDKLADAKTRALFKMLVDNYGKGTFSGQYVEDEPYVRQQTGKTPAILGADLIEYSPTRISHGSKPNPTTEQIIARAKAGQIITLTWHWNAPSGLIDATYTDKNGKSINAPWWRGFYTDATTFDLEKTLANPDSSDYKLLLSDIDTIAVQLKKLQAAGVPVLWRPLHEADGAWFWWGADGPAPFKSLWKIMFDRLTTTHNLHNLIWVYTGSAEKLDWYPGDKLVDIVGIDAYPDDRTDPQSNSWETLRHRFDGKKLLALTEFKGAPDVGKMKQFGVQWSYFAAWTGDMGTKSQDVAQVKRAYSDPNTLNLDAVKR